MFYANLSQARTFLFHIVTKPPPKSLSQPPRLCGRQDLQIAWYGLAIFPNMAPKLPGDTRRLQQHFDQLMQQQRQRQRWSDVSSEITPPKLAGSANASGLAPSELLQRKISSSSSDLDFPLPWQGNIDLPESDEETMNAAQVGRGVFVCRVCKACCDNAKSECTRRPANRCSFGFIAVTHPLAIARFCQRHVSVRPHVRMVFSHVELL